MSSPFSKKDAAKMLERMSNSGSDESDESDGEYTGNNPTPGANRPYESQDRVYHTGIKYCEGTFLYYTSGAMAKVLFDGEVEGRSIQVGKLRPINGGQNQTTTLNTATVASTPQAENDSERKNGDESDLDDLSYEAVQNEEGGQKRGHDTSVDTENKRKRLRLAAAKSKIIAEEEQLFVRLEKEIASLKGKITNLEKENANLLARCETNMERLKEIDTLTTERDNLAAKCDSLEAALESSLEAALAAARDNFNAAFAASFNGI
ncbi:hypothetical protein TrRE_jg1847 [Triparma retinervis]|uniref:Uncharacterized protein n=1 Tax=Triparma retinervis TaxID=2557542 RepID=A0A9W7FW89_9STRA|nr:hypothetical protein TrRE_jg1847 [Triparma retinervis]